MFDNKCHKTMKSERAKRFIDDTSIIIEPDSNRVISQSTVVGIFNAYIAIELAEQDAELRLRKKAHKIIKEMMEGVFQGNMPQNIADEFSQKLSEK